VTLNPGHDAHLPPHPDALYSGIAMYGRSKLLMMMWGRELQRRLHRAGIRGVDVFATHPGEGDCRCGGGCLGRHVGGLA
jgi:hypothetical protein